MLGDGAVDVYDPRRDTWASRAPMPPPYRTWFGAAALDGKIYVVGGSDANIFEMTTLFDTVQEYDPKLDRWTERAPLLRPRGLLAAATLHGRIYALGGDSWWEVGPFTAMAEAYDPETDTWTPQAPLRTGRNALGAVTLEGKLYTVGGWDWAGPSAALERDVFPEATITAPAGGCLAVGIDGSTVMGDARAIVDQGDGGRVTVTCRASGVMNGTGAAVHLESASMPWMPCLVMNGWLPHLWDWEESITADGEATLRCWYPGT